MATRLALDTNTYVDFCRGVEDAVSVVRRAREIFLPFIVIGELRAGFRAGSKRTANDRVLSSFLSSQGVSVLLADEQTTHLYARVFGDLKKAGTPIPTNDLWIAALVIQFDLALFTRDKHFNYISEIPII